jgi:hypothetical protein
VPRLLETIRGLHIFLRVQRICVRCYDLTWDIDSLTKASVVVSTEELCLSDLCKCGKKRGGHKGRGRGGRGGRGRRGGRGPGRGRGRGRGRGAGDTLADDADDADDGDAEDDIWRTMWWHPLCFYLTCCFSCGYIFSL